MQAVDFLCLALNGFLLVLNVLALIIQLILSTLHLTLFLIELLVTLLYSLLLLMKFLLGLTHLIFVFQLERNKLLFCLNNFVFLDYFGLFLRLAENA